MANKHYFDFIGTFWDLLPDSDKDRMGELWHGYEQVFASAYQYFVENDLNVSVQTLQPYATERWLDYQFGTANSVSRPPIYTSTQDLSVGINLSERFLVRFSIDGGPDIEIDCRGKNPGITTIDEIITIINRAAGFAFARTIFENSIIQLVSTTQGVDSSIEFKVPSKPMMDATEFILGIEQIDLPARFPHFPYVYTLPYQSIYDIPYLQDKIRDESVPTVMTAGIDYAIERKTGLITFKNEPTAQLWAKQTLFDQETPWNNFGFLMGIYQPNIPSYLSVIQGLWYAFWTGPTPDNVQSSLYLLFGLPVAQEDGIVTNVTAQSVETTSRSGRIRQFSIPSSLNAVVSVGQSVTRFQPLVDGIEVFDKINRPGFVTTEIGRAGVRQFLTQNASTGPGDTDETKAMTLLEEHTFLPQISVDAFVSPDINISNVKTFLNGIKPLSKAFFFQVIVGAFREPIPFQEQIALGIDIDLTPNVDSNQTTFLDPATLLAYETALNDALNLDQDGVLFEENVQIAVYQSGNLIDSFEA